MKNRILIITCFLYFLIVSCTSDIYNPDVCFQENVLPVFVSKCSTTGCHDASEHEAGYNLSNYEGILKGVKPKHPLQSEIYNQIRGANPSMPPKGSTQLTDKEITYIKIWIKMGAKNSSNCSVCDTSLYTYSGRIKPLLDTWCVGCHNSNNKGGGYDLSSYNKVIVAVADGSLLGTIKHESGYIAMPKNTSKLTDCDVNAIEKWIAGGYLNN